MSLRSLKIKILVYAVGFFKCSFWEVLLEMFCIEEVINKQKYCFERKSWIAMKAKKIVIVLYCFWERYEGIENIYKTRKKSTKSHADSCYYAIFLERFHSEATAGGVLSKKVYLKFSQIPHLCWRLFWQKQPLEVFCKKRRSQKFANFIGKHLCWSAFNKVCEKKTPTQVSSCEVSEIFKNIYFEERMWTTASFHWFIS